MPSLNCPKCDADISDTYEPDDHSVGVVGGWYCDACNEGFAAWEYEHEPYGDGVDFTPAPPSPKPLGTPISEISGRPGQPGYEEFVRIAKSWGFA